MKTTTTRAANRNTAAHSLTRSVVAELLGDRHVDADLLALSRRWDAARPVVVATALHAAQRARVLAVGALLLALAGLAAACLFGRRYASRGVSLALSLLATGSALARRHYPAARARVASAAATLATATNTAAAAVRDGSSRPPGQRPGRRRAGTLHPGRPDAVGRGLPSPGPWRNVEKKSLRATFLL
jgi:hypothetical protein